MCTFIILKKSPKTFIKQLCQDQPRLLPGPVDAAPDVSCMPPSMPASMLRCILEQSERKAGWVCQMPLAFALAAATAGRQVVALLPLWSMWLPQTLPHGTPLQSAYRSRKKQYITQIKTRKSIIIWQCFLQQYFKWYAKAELHLATKVTCTLSENTNELYSEHSRLPCKSLLTKLWLLQTKTVCFFSSRLIWSFANSGVESDHLGTIYFSVSQTF